MRQKKRVVPIVALVFLAIMAIGIRQTESLVPSALAAQVTLRPDDPGSLSERMPVISMPGSSSHAELEVQRSSPTSGSQTAAVPGQTLAVGQAQGQIAYTGADGNLWVMAADGNNAHPVTTGLGATWDAEWSPDGSRIAFGTSSAAYVVNHDGTGLRQLAGGLHEPFAFDWSADGGRILFTAGQFGTYVVNSDGSSLAMIVDNIGDHMMGAGISPDGQWVAIPAKKDNGRWGIYRHNLSNQQGEWMPGEFYCTIRSSLCPTQPFTYYADWSPDGGRIAFVGVRTEEYLCGFFQWCGRAFPAIYTLSANGGAAPVWLGDISTTQNPTGAAAFRDLDWDAGSFRLAAPGVAADGKWHVHVYNGVLVQVFGGREGEGIEKLDFAPSGSRLVTDLWEGGVSSIYVVDAATGGWSAALANGTWPDWGRDAPANTPTPTATLTPTPTSTSTPTPTATPTAIHCPMTDETIDTDSDGLPDAWEVCGVDTDGDGEIDVDLAAMGAKKDHKDIFIEVDWMSTPCTSLVCFKSHTHKPKDGVLEDVVEAFARSPLQNKDGSPGITLHVFLDEEIDHIVRLDYEQFLTIRETHFSRNRRLIFHYALFAHELDSSVPDDGAPCHSGVAFGSDFIVTLGGWGAIVDGFWCNKRSDMVGTSLQQAGTFMHELGHAIGLQHGGPISKNDAENQIYINYKPNYLSVMNYWFQTRGLRKNGKDGYLDYSGFSEVRTLEEKGLWEELGLQGGTELTEYGTRWSCYPDTILPSLNQDVTDFVNLPIDWDCDGIRSEIVQEDINKSGAKEDILVAFNDWDNIQLGYGCIGPRNEGDGDCLNQEIGALGHESDFFPAEYFSPDITLESDSEILTSYSVSVSAVEHGTVDAMNQDYLVAISNTGSITDTYDVKYTCIKCWGTPNSIPEEITIFPQHSIQIEFAMTIPNDAQSGDYDKISIRATSRNNPRITDIATIWAGVVDPALVVTPTPTPSLEKMWLPMIQR